VAGNEEPSQALHEPRELLLAYLDYYREAALQKIDGLSDDDLRRSRLPSGWTPLELVQHLAYMERRWLQWGFAGEDVPDPFGDADPETRLWRVAGDVPVTDIVARLREAGRRTRAIVEGADLDEQAPPGPRFQPDRPPPALSWILVHVLQEYARHVGHLDIVRELSDGSVGE
jgi:hypothetical protein